jgi:membrane protein
MPSRFREDAGLAIRTLPKRVSGHNLTLVSAGVAFYAFLAFIPTLIVFVSVYGLFADPADVERQVHGVVSALPDEVEHFIDFQITSIAKSSSANVSITLVVALLVALWSASGGIAALLVGIRVALGYTTPLGYVKKKTKALAVTAGAVVLLAIIVFIVAALPPVLEDSGLPHGGRLVVDVARWPLLLVVMVVGIGVLYRLADVGREGTSRRTWLGVVSLGTVTAALAWALASVGFGIYTANFASYSKTYGTLTSIVVVLLWLYLSAFAVLIGAEVDGYEAQGPVVSSPPGAVPASRP